MNFSRRLPFKKSASSNFVSCLSCFSQNLMYSNTHILIFSINKLKTIMYGYNIYPITVIIISGENQSKILYTVKCVYLRTALKMVRKFQTTFQTITFRFTVLFLNA